MITRLFFIFIGIILLKICNGAELNSNEAEAKIFLQQASDKIFNLYDEISNESYTNVNYSYTNLKEAIINSAKIMVHIYQDTKKFDYKNFKDKELKYAFESIAEEAGEVIIGPERYWEIFDNLKDLEYWSKDHNIEGYHNSSEELAYFPDVKKIIETSSDPDELEHYWIKWREITGNWGSNYFNTTIEGLTDAANLSDMTPLKFWMQGSNSTKIENLMKEIQPLYEELHAFVRNLLRKKYGDSIIKSDGLIPDHLFEQVLDQAYLNGSIIDEMFPYDSLPPVDSIMKKRFKAINLYEIAERFYKSLGFEEYPYEFLWKKRIKMSKKLDDDDDDDDCTPYIYYWSPNVYLEYCDKLSLMNLLEAYIHMGNLYYAKEMTGLPAYFFDTHGLDSAIGKAVTLSTSTHFNLKAIGIILDFNSTEDIEMNRLLRKSIHSILSIPMDFIQIKLMADLLSGNVELANLNTHYWHLMDKYAGVGPPIDYETYNDYDFPYNFFQDVNDNKMSRKFETDILSYQIYKKICELSGKYAKGNLHLCDVHGSKDAGNALKKMMRLGYSKPFVNVMATMFPENPTIGSESLLEYYKPVRKLLETKNKKDNVKIGWKSSQ